MIRRRRVAAAAAGIAVAAGGGVAIAATTGTSRQEREQAVLADAADRLGVSPDRLRDALAAAEDAQLDAAVKAGDLTQAQAEAIKAMRQRSGLVLDGAGGPGGPRVFGVGGGRDGVLRPESGATGAAFDAAAKALGLDREALFTQLREGKTLSHVAQDRNVAVDDVRAAARAAAKTELEDGVRDGDLTQAQADHELDEILAWIERFPPGPRFGHGPGHELGPGRAVLGAAAKALGLSEMELFRRLRGGQTLADIAKAQNTTLADVRAAARAAAETALADDVRAGRLTQEQADALLDRIVEGIDHFPADRPFGRRP